MKREHIEIGKSYWVVDNDEVHEMKCMTALHDKSFLFVNAEKSVLAKEQWSGALMGEYAVYADKHEAIRKAIKSLNVTIGYYEGKLDEYKQKLANVRKLTEECNALPVT